MPLSNQQIDTLLNLVATTGEDELDCDGCFDHVSQFVETKLANRTLCESMLLVENHLQNCPCCKDEFEALLAAMSQVEGGR